MIEIGDILLNCQDAEIEVEEVEKGKHGLLVTGHFVGKPLTFAGYVLWELPAIEEEECDWYNWPFRSFFTLPSEMRVGLVCFARGDWRSGVLQEYEKEWERTTATIREEEQGDESRL